VVLAAALAGEALGVVAACQAGLRSVVVDAGVAGTPLPGAVAARPRGLRGDLVSADALDGTDVADLLALGRRIGADAARHGVVALGEVGVGNTTVAAALTAALLGLAPEMVVGLGAGADREMLDRKAEVVTAALARAGDLYPGTLRDPAVALAALGGPEFAVLTGVTLGAAEAGAMVILDGLATSVSALIATRFEPAVAAHLIAGQRSREAAHGAVLAELGLEPLLDLRIRAGEGAGACLAVGLLRAALVLRHDTARTADGP
jgi:nicotinate-nucleotide--dimethylbenzimidazole phosphoribosyltransferase